MAKSPRGKPIRKDGRIARGERTRKAILRAHAHLIRDGDLTPSARTIADKAGVSVRTIWQYFDDMNSLILTSATMWIETDDRIRRVVSPDAPLETRIKEYCEERARRLESVAPVAAAATLHSRNSEALADLRRRNEIQVRTEISELFADVLGAEPDQVVIDSLVGTVTWPLWSQMRNDFHRSVDETLAVMQHMLSGLIQAQIATKI